MAFLLWMDEILHHLETMGNHCLLVFTGESSFQGFLGGAGFRPSTVCDRIDRNLESWAFTEWKQVENCTLVCYYTRI